MRARVQRLEHARQGQSAVAADFGSFAQFEAWAGLAIGDGLLDQRDFPVVITCLRRWESGEGRGT